MIISFVAVLFVAILTYLFPQFMQGMGNRSKSVQWKVKTQRKFTLWIWVIQTIIPEYAIVPCRKNNFHAHSHRIMLKRLDDVGATVSRNNINRTVTVTVKDGKYTITPEFE